MRIIAYRPFTRLFFFVLIFSALINTYPQNDVMLQAFYWDVPVDAENHNGSWWDTLKSKSASLKNAGITALWIPPPSKGNFGIYDMGYGIFDHYDLGNYNQKGTIETRFGSRDELLSMISAMHSNNILVYADIVLNHIYANEEQSENNPAVKEYVFDEALRNGGQFQAYPTSEITWKIPDASPGDYYIQIKGYLLDWNASFTQRGYDLFIDWTGAGSNGSADWEFEPNNGQGMFNNFPGTGRTMQAHVESVFDKDEYKISLTTPHDITIKLIPRKEGISSNGVWEWQYARRENGYYPSAVFYNGANITNELLAFTNTGINYPSHTGPGEHNYSWNYSHFHPSDENDWLGFPGNDEIVTNTKLFGNDVNTFNDTVKKRYKDWGYWLADQIGFDGFRLDFVRGFQDNFAADWIKNLPLLNNKQRFIVGEYWGAEYRIKDWVNNLAAAGADADAFDFPLKYVLTEMCNSSGSSFDMNRLNHAGIIRNTSGNSLPGTSIVTFAENHDTGKEHDKWISKDYKLAYAYILTHEGRPCLFYSHYYGVTQSDIHNNSFKTTAPSELQSDINKLIHVRKNYLGGKITVLSETGNPHPSEATHNVYAARREGNGVREGAIIIINNHDSLTKGLWVDSSPGTLQNWSDSTLVDAFDINQTAEVQSDGRVFLSAPPRGYKIWVKQKDFIPYE